MSRVAISSGHGQFVAGASGVIVEVAEARRVTARVVALMRKAGRGVVEFHDNTSRNQATNLSTIVAWHNRQTRDLDCSVHFNHTGGPIIERPVGTETLFVSQAGRAIAARVSPAIATAGGFINRGPKHRTNLAFLN